MIHNQYLEREKKEGRGNDSCHFSDQYFLNCFLFFYVNIQPSCSKTRVEYFNMKIRLLILLILSFLFFDNFN